MEFTGDIKEYMARPYMSDAASDSTTASGETAGPSYDERRGEHLLSPGDLVRHGSNFWKITGVFLGADPSFSKVAMRRFDDATEYVVPLLLLDACSIFLLAEKRSP